MAPSSFGKQRAERYSKALKECPAARIRELIPILLLSYRRERDQSIVVDLGSGTGYLSDLLASIYQEVIQIDGSQAMAAQSGNQSHTIHSPMQASTHLLPDDARVDLVTSLAALHHVTVFEDQQINSEKSKALQAQLIRSWADRLAPGGKLLFVDVFHAPIDIRSYYRQKQQLLSNILLEIDYRYFEVIDRRYPDYQLLKTIREYIYADLHYISMSELIQNQILDFVNEVKKEIPVDFFEQIVATYSIDGHLACFPEELTIRSALEEAGLYNICTTFIPTPWEFNSEAEAVWFIHELFGIGLEAVADPATMLNHSDYTSVKEYIQHYLGLYQQNGRYFINWQLMFIYGEKALL